MVGLAEGGVLEAAGLVLRLSTDDGVATGCEPLGDGSAVTAEGDPTGREDTCLLYTSHEPTRPY